MAREITEKRILVVAAHPDDEVLGAGGAIAKHVSDRDEVTILILGGGITSRSGLDATEEERQLKELRSSSQNSAKILGVKKLISGDLSDQKFDTLPLLAITQVIEQVISNVAPNIIYTHHTGDVNMDHRIAAEAVEAATRPLPGTSFEAVYAFEVPSSTEWNFAKSSYFRPNVFIDISAVYDKKVAALKAYESEMRQFPHPRSYEYIEALSKVRGGQSGFQQAEAFQLIYKRNP